MESYEKRNKAKEVAWVLHFCSRYLTTVDLLVRIGTEGLAKAPIRLHITWCHVGFGRCLPVGISTAVQESRSNEADNMRAQKDFRRPGDARVFGIGAVDRYLFVKTIEIEQRNADFVLC